MVKKKNKGFTLIELVAVLVIMAILALIVTPLVMSIIKKAKLSADKRSVDAYGRSIELAIAGYLMDTGSFPTSIGELTIEYIGDEVVCTTTQLNSDSSVYLSGCTVGGRSVEGYTYGKGGGEEPTPTYTAYTVGDQVTYNNVDYYVIENSGANETSVKLLKAEPLTVAEVNQYGGVGTANNHVNMYALSSTMASSYRTAYNKNGYGGMAYYSSSTCGYDGNAWIDDGCTTDYAESEIKYVVDAWKTAQAPAASEARLITYEELLSNFEYENNFNCTPDCYYSGSLANIPTWVYNSNYWYWTMSPNDASTFTVWYVSQDGGLSGSDVKNNSGVVRPVITISKSALSN